MNNQKEIVLLPCPFCGGRAKTYPNSFGGDIVKCINITCGADIVYLKKGNGDNWAIDKWNTRKPSQEQGLALDEVKNVRDCLCLLNSMVLSGEEHSEFSQPMFDKALSIIDNFIYGKES